MLYEYEARTKITGIKCGEAICSRYGAVIAENMEEAVKKVYTLYSKNQSVYGEIVELHMIAIPDGVGECYCAKATEV